MVDNRIQELACRARDRNIFVYTDFLNEQAQEEISNAFPADFVNFFGGADFAERKIARFGNANEVGYTEDFPIQLVLIHAKGGKFATAITHRDVLGALMSLGVVREKVGDIFVGDDCVVALHSTVAPLILSELNSVGRNLVDVSVCQVDTAYAPKTELRNVVAQSNRLDAILSKVYNLSREKAVQLVKLGKVSVNGTPVQKAERALQLGEKVSVRGYGKFEFCGEAGQSKKGKTYFSVKIFL